MIYKNMWHLAEVRKEVFSLYWCENNAVLGQILKNRLAQSCFGDLWSVLFNFPLLKVSYQWIQTPPRSTAAGSACCCLWRGGAYRRRGPCCSGRAAGGWSHWGCSQCCSAAAGWCPERRARSPDRGKAGSAWALRSLCPGSRAGSEVAPPSGQKPHPYPNPRGGATNARTGSRGSA